MGSNEDLQKKKKPSYWKVWDGFGKSKLIGERYSEEGQHYKALDLVLLCIMYD